MKGGVAFSEQTVPGHSIYSVPLYDCSVAILLALVHLKHIF